MSYILDALKKSEQERGNRNIPGVQTVHSSSLNYTNKKTYWPYFLIAAILLNLIAILYFVFEKDNKTVIEKNGASIVATPADRPVTQQNVIDKRATIDSRKIETSSTSPVTIPIQPTEPAIKLTHTNDKNIVEFYDLPKSLKQQLPTITISAHVYSSNPLHRSIVINNNFLEEGEYIMDDLVLYEITSDGAVLSYHDILFHYGIVSTWQ